MNKTQFKNNFDKYFKQTVDSKIVSIKSDKINTLEINYKKNNRNLTLNINSNIQMTPDGILDFTFTLCKEKCDKVLDEVLNDIHTITEISLYEAKDIFCQEQALEFKYNEENYFYILIYTNMVENSLEIFEEKLDAKKFKKVAF